MATLTSAATHIFMIRLLVIMSSRTLKPAGRVSRCPSYSSLLSDPLILDLNSLTYKGDVSDTILSMSQKNVKIYTPVPYQAHGKPAGYSLDNLGWINPKGIWSPAYDDPARYETPPTNANVSDTDLDAFDTALSLNT